eukprot:2345728-Karenia_brevis.AAC.1
MRALPRWKGKGNMGIKNMSKRVTLAEFDEDHHNPVLTYLVLRSWMLMRFQWHGFSEQRKCRKKWLQREQEKLKSDILALEASKGSTGSARADMLISQWQPSVLAP